MELKGVVVVDDAAEPIGAAEPARLGAREQVANRPIAHHVLDVLEAAGATDVVVASSARLAAAARECLATRERSGMRLQFVQQPEPLDIMNALQLVAPIVGGAPCIVHLASGLLAESLRPVVGRILRDSPDVVLIVYQGRATDGRLSAATQEMLHIAEFDPERVALSMAGVCLFGPGALRHASKVPWRVGGDIDVTMVAEGIGAAGGGLRVLPAAAWRRYAGDPLDLLELNRIALDRLDIDLHRPSNNGNRIEGRVRIHPEASVHASVIVGPVVIGPGAKIADAYIGPYTSIGERARVEGTEIERSIVANGASITHVGGRLVASVVGRDARVFRDFSLPRALRLRVGDGTVVGLC